MIYLLFNFFWHIPTYFSVISAIKVKFFHNHLFHIKSLADCEIRLQFRLSKCDSWPSLLLGVPRLLSRRRRHGAATSWTAHVALKPRSNASSVVDMFTVELGDWIISHEISEADGATQTIILLCCFGCSFSALRLLTLFV